MATNGTPSNHHHHHYHHHPLSSPSSQPESQREGLVKPIPDFPRYFSTTYIDTHIQGHNSPARNNAPVWSPAALLQPNRRSPASAQLTNARSVPPPVPRQVPQMAAQPGYGSSMVFQFSSPNGTPSAGPSSEASTPVSSDAQGTAAPVNWLERIHNVQARTEAPEAKRRRVDSDDDQNGTKMPVRGSSGILGQYVKDKRLESSSVSTPQQMPQSMTVDLTSGMYPMVKAYLLTH